MIIRKSLEAGEQNHQIGILEVLETGDVITARLDGAVLWVGGHKITALESVMFGQDSCECRQGFFPTVFVITGDEDDVFSLSRSRLTLPDHPVGMLGPFGVFSPNGAFR